MQKVKAVWSFIEEQWARAQRRFAETDYRGCIDLLYDIAGNVANLYLLLEKGSASADKGRLLNILSLMWRAGILSEDFGALLRARWPLRNIAKYGYFASPRLEIKEITIAEADVRELLTAVKRLLAQFRRWAGERLETD